MNIVLDEDLSRSIGRELRKYGHEIFDIRDHGLRGKPDAEVFQFAQKQNAILFSADLGFANIMQFPLGSHAGIVILRFPNEMRTETINTIVMGLLRKIPEKDIAGNLVIFSPSGLRLKRY